MWRVNRGGIDSGEAIEAFGAICVTRETAGRLGLTNLSDPRGDLGQGDLYGLEDLSRANGVKGCSAAPAERTYTLPAEEPDTP